MKRFPQFTRCVVSVALLLWASLAQADQAQYVYDELGRLVAVVDGQGNAAVYNYDEVGNLLSIDRFTTGTTGIGIFLVTPSSGLVNTTVQIRGFGFSATASENQVAFNGTAATVVSATTSTLEVTVPTGATTGPVTVTNANGAATSPQAFTVLVPPIISGVQPDRVPQGVTSKLTISGFNLATASAVTFTQSGLSATILAGVTAQSLSINLSVGGSVPPGSYPFSVTTLAGTAQSGSITVTVTPPVPSFSVGKASVFRPYPAQVAPSGTTMSVSPPVSVSMP